MLSAIHEEDFLGFSYVFRPKRSQHDALDALIVGISSKKVNFILDADIRSFFTEVSQQWVIRFLEHRIGDTRILRLTSNIFGIGSYVGVAREQEGMDADGETGRRVSPEAADSSSVAQRAVRR